MLAADEVPLDQQLAIDAFEFIDGDIEQIGPESGWEVMMASRRIRSICTRSWGVARLMKRILRDTIITSQPFFPDKLGADCSMSPSMSWKASIASCWSSGTSSPQHAEGQGRRAVAIDKAEKFSLMINEEDHLRIQVMQSGFNLQSVWEQINAIDSAIEQKVTYAFHERLGYLTACPTNVGTGMRVSVMLHLPALVITRQIEKVFRSLQKISLAVRGLFGEGSQAMGDFYQISNQITLGRSEDELVQQVNDIVPVIIDYERQARQFLVKESQENLHDRVSRAYGILRTAQTISSEETMHLLSSVRMGVNLGLIPDLPIADINELFIHTQPAHLQKRTGGDWAVPIATSSGPAICGNISTAKTGPSGPRRTKSPRQCVYLHRRHRRQAGLADLHAGPAGPAAGAGHRPDRGQRRERRGGSGLTPPIYHELACRRHRRHHLGRSRLQTVRGYPHPADGAADPFVRPIIRPSPWPGGDDLTVANQVRVAGSAFGAGLHAAG